jgi:hypothetical protein
MDDVQKVKEVIDKKHALSNGSCGIRIPDIAFDTGFSYAVLNPILRKLYNEQYFVLKQGINGKMIFKKT